MVIVLGWSGRNLHQRRKVSDHSETSRLQSWDCLRDRLPADSAQPRRALWWTDNLWSSGESSLYSRRHLSIYIDKRLMVLGYGAADTSEYSRRSSNHLKPIGKDVNIIRWGFYFDWMVAGPVLSFPRLHIEAPLKLLPVKAVFFLLYCVFCVYFVVFLFYFVFLLFILWFSCFILCFFCLFCGFSVLFCVSSVYFVVFLFYFVFLLFMLCFFCLFCGFLFYFAAVSCLHCSARPQSLFHRLVYSSFTETAAKDHRLHKNVGTVTISTDKWLQF